MKLTRVEAAGVEAAMANTRDGAGLSFREFVAYAMSRDPQPAIKNLQSRFPGFTVEELEWMRRFDWISDFPNGWYLRGVARRVAKSDLGEFASFLQMDARQAVLNYTVGDNEFTQIWPLLRALSLGDAQVVDAFIDVASFPLESGHPDSCLVHNAVHSLLRSRPDKVNPQLKGRPARKRPDWIEGILTCLEGVIAGDAAQLTRGMEQHLQGFRKATRINPLEKIISLEAHGLYRLAERSNPDLVAKWDTAAELPWDSEFHEWSSDHKPELKMDAFPGCPEPVAAAFVSLKRPRWAV